MCDLLRFGGKVTPLALARADHACAYKRRPTRKEDELAAVVKLVNPRDGLRYGSFPGTQLFGSTEAAHRYYSLSRAIAPLARRYPEIPFVGNFDYFATVKPEALVNEALQSFAEFNDVPFTTLKRLKSQNGPAIGYLELTAGFRDKYGETIASLSLSYKRIRKSVSLVNEIPESRKASLAELRKLAGKWRFAQEMVMGRFGKAALKPVYGLIARGGGTLPRGMKKCLRRWELTRPNIAPRLMTSSEQAEGSNPVSILIGVRRGGVA